jgi:hypothetical protein
MARRWRGLRSARSGTEGLSLASLVVLGTGRAGLLFRLVWLLVRHTLFLLAVGGEGLGGCVEIARCTLQFLFLFFYTLFFSFFLVGYGFFVCCCGVLGVFSLFFSFPFRIGIYLGMRREMCTVYDRVGL